MGEQFAINKLDQGMLIDSAAFPPIPEFRNMMDPLNYRVVVYPRKILSTSKGGIEIPEATIDSMRYLRQVGCIVAMGPTAFTHPDLKANNNPTIGDWVFLPRHVGEYEEHVGFLDGENDSFLLKVVRDVDIMGKFPEGLTDVRAM